jgi:RND family efflux transporter MFP subunit
MKYMLIPPALLLALSLAGCGEQAVHEAGDLPPVNVTVVTVTAQSTEEPVAYSATIQAAEQAQIATKVIGRVEAMHVNEGDVVKKGDRLANLRSDEVDAKLSQADAGIAEATAHFENAERDLERFQSLFEKKAVTQKELDNVRVAYESARARLQVARESKKEVEEMLKYVRITAPFDGVVTKKFVDVGDMAMPGQPILNVEQIDELEAVATVPEGEIGRFTVGMPVVITIPMKTADSPRKEYAGDITQIVLSADPASHQFRIKAVLTTQDEGIKPGMFARITVSKQGKDALMAPVVALFQRGQLEGVFVVDAESRARLRWIRTGRTIGEYREILAGLESGEQVVLSGQEKLKDGQKVVVQ